MKIVLKLGGSAITEKDVRDFPTDINEIEKRADEYMLVDHIRRQGRELHEAISGCGCSLVLINGAGPFGHHLVNTKQPLEVVHKSVECLNRRLIEHLNNNLDTVPIAPFDTCKWKDGKFNVGNLWSEVKKVMENGRIPSTYGDILKGYKVISGDDLAVLLAGLWHADKIIMASDIDGVYSDFETKEVVTIIRGGEDIEFKDSHVDVTGGLSAKLRKLQSTKIKSQIINGLVPENIKKAILGDESIGTLVLPKD
jgi:isopentenyl phosphate kinase